MPHCGYEFAYIFPTGHHLEGSMQAYRVLAGRGKGDVAGFTAQLDIVPLLIGHKRLIGIGAGSRAMFEALNRFVALANIRPVIDRVFGFGQAAKACAYLEGAGHFGKVVVKVGRS